MGRKCKDETGNRYGRLTVIERAPVTDKKGRAYWRCVCDCGNERIVVGESLRHGNTKSCGCLRRELAHEGGKNKRIKDETGNRYGRLFVIRRACSKKSSAMWICRCDCGKYTEVFGSALRSGNTTSCGCYRRERKVLARGMDEKQEVSEC